MAVKRVNVKAILADPDLRRKLMVSTIQATQAREGIDTTPEQADRAYHVVNEADKASFISLASFRGSRGDADRREEMFVRAIQGKSSCRYDVARRDFSSIDGCPLAYQQVGLVAHLFRENPSLDPAFARARRGAYTGDDSRYVRQWWEPGVRTAKSRFEWKPFAKGGTHSRFYSDIDLVAHWDPARNTFADFHGRKGRVRREGRPESVDDFFKPGLTWPLAARLLNIRLLPAGCIFSHKGPVILSGARDVDWYLLAILNTSLVLYLARCLTSREDMGGRWEVGVIKRIPVPDVDQGRRVDLARMSRAIHDSKAAWDTGNEISTSFHCPWLLRDDVIAGASSLAASLVRLTEYETAEEHRIQQLHATLEDEVYRSYGIPDATRAAVEATLGERTHEILWPQMAGKSVDQKRMEHVWRLLSYAVKRVLEADDDGIVSFNAVNGESRLVERVRHELGTFFPERDANQVEVEIVNELKRTVKGYLKCASLDEWLGNAFFEYHARLYKSRPIYWHIASAQGGSRYAFSALVHYHRLDKNRIAKVRASYLRDAIEEFRREAGLADKAGRSDDRLELQAKVEEAQALDKKLQQIQEGHHEGAEGGERDFRILTPWKKPAERPRGWAPDLDDGVMVNIAPFERAGVLRVRGLVG